MAKDPDHLAGFDTENTGGVLSGFLAEEDQFDRHALWRLGTWGVAAVAAVVVGVMANQSSLGSRREQMVTADLLQQANRLQTVAKESQNESRRLASAVDTLNSDRDRLYSRVTVLEQGLDSVTGAIARQHPALAAPSPPAAAPESQPVPAVAPVATAPAAPPEKTSEPAPAAEPAPVNVSSVTKNTANKDTANKDTPNKDTPNKDTASKDAPAKKDVPANDVAARDAGNKPAASPATPLVESKSMMAPPDPAAGKLIETGKSAIAAEPIPEVVASAPAAGDAQAEAETSLPRIQRTEFGVDVGGANSVPGLRALWRGLLKSRSNAPLAALRPIIVIKEGSGGLGMQLRLVAGPLHDAAAAAKICAAMNENKRPCETTVFDGQRLTVDANEPAPAAKPAPSRRRGAAKQAAVEEAAKKPEPAPATTTTAASTISSFFNRKRTE